MRDFTVCEVPFYIQKFPVNLFDKPFIFDYNEKNILYK